MHYLYVEDEIGDLVDTIPFCSDSCHRQYCMDKGVKYEGWNGCHETEFSTICASCGAKIEGVNEDE